MAKLGTFSGLEAASDNVDATQNNEPAVATEAPEETGQVSVDIPDDAPAETTTANDQPDDQPQASSNESSFELSDWDAPDASEDKAPASPPTSWQDAVANVDREELLKHLGLDEFTINLHKHLSNGGSASDYLEAKARDWNAVPDMDIMRMEYAAMYPNLNEVEIDRLLVKKYGEDDLDEDGQIELKADAYKARQKLIERDKNFKIADKPAQQQQQQNNSEEIEAQIQEQIRYFANHEATKALSQSKRVAVDLGDGQSFNFNIDKPESLMRVITDASIWQRVVSNEKGEPDVAKLQQIALFAVNPQKFVKDLVNYGKSLGHLREIEEGRNAVPPKGQPARAANEKPSYSIGTYGRR